MNGRSDVSCAERKVSRPGDDEMPTSRRIGSNVERRDDGAFEEMFRRHRRELHIHCYRMTGSLVEAEDLVQETFVRAWRGLDAFQARASLRAWLYRIATNTCLDALEHRGRRTIAAGDITDLLGESGAIQPYPNALLDPPGSGNESPDSAVVAKETIELGFIAALLHLPPRQRAVLIVRDVLGMSAVEAGELLDHTVAATNSLLQRARRTLQRRARGGRLDWARPPMNDDDRAVLRRYIEAHERGDADAIVEMLRSDVRLTMPPESPCIGADSAAAFFHELLGPEGPGEWHLVETYANGWPAAANYLRHPADAAFRAFSIDVLHHADGRLVEVNCFLDKDLFPTFGLPLTH